MAVEDEGRARPGAGHVEIAVQGAVEWGQGGQTGVIYGGRTRCLCWASRQSFARARKGCRQGGMA